MYGHMLLGLSGFVQLKYDKDTWTQSCTNAGLDTHVFFMYEVYEDDTFFNIVDAVCEILGSNSTDLLFDFGYYTFSVYWRNSKHDTLLYGLGDDLYELLQSLNALHHHLSAKYDKMVAPSFTCDVVPDGLLVHYHSARPRLGEYVKGILCGLASHVYRLNVDVDIVEYTKLPSEEALYHYYKLKVSLKGAVDDSIMSRLRGSKRVEKRSAKKLVDKMKGVFHVIDPENRPTHSLTVASAPEAGDTDWPITPEIFNSIVPFYLIVDSELKIVIMGVGFTKLFGSICYHECLNDLFDIEIPRVTLTHSNILNELNSLFILSAKDSAIRKKKARLPPSFRGQMYSVKPSQDSPILFLASPSANNFEQLEEMGFNVTDIGKSNPLHELLENHNYYNPQMDLSGQLEKTKYQLEIEKAEVEKARERTDTILHCMLPVQVASDLKNNGSVTPMEFSQVSILFTSIAGFQSICKESSPHEVVTLLNTLFTRFDNLIERHQVYKVETVSDSYMMAAGFPNTAQKHAHAVTNMAFEMREEENTREGSHKNRIEILIGIHSGPVVTGVIGTRQPRYCLFGDTVNTASRMNSTGEPGMIHISEATYGHIKEDKSYHFINRGEIFIKGLGLRTTYFVEAHSPMVENQVPVSGSGQLQTSVQLVDYESEPHALRTHAQNTGLHEELPHNNASYGGTSTTHLCVLV